MWISSIRFVWQLPLSPQVQYTYRFIPVLHLQRRISIQAANPLSIIRACWRQLLLNMFAGNCFYFEFKVGVLYDMMDVCLETSFSCYFGFWFEFCSAPHSFFSTAGISVYLCLYFKLFRYSELASIYFHGKSKCI